MVKIFVSILYAVLVTMPVFAQASPEQDLKVFQQYFVDRFPKVDKEEFANGVYSFDMNSRNQWLDIEEFAPYEIAIEEGEELFNTPFRNGKTYASCFKNEGIGIRNDYPYFNSDTGQVHTLAYEINRCREKSAEAPLKYKKGKITSLLAYMSFTTRGKVINTVIPSDPMALAAYEKGKAFFYARRGQLNMSCAHCHVDNSGNRLRAETLSPALGQLSHFPVYRAKWGGMGTINRRFSGCNKQVRATPFPAQSEEYRNLEYFLTYMSNGLHWNGPGVRR